MGKTYRKTNYRKENREDRSVRKRLNKADRARRKQAMRQENYDEAIVPFRGTQGLEST